MGDGSGGGGRRMIRDGDRYLKTESGRAEIANRSQKLAPALRSILLLVDGQRDAATLRKLAAGVHAPPDALDQLLAMRLIGSEIDAGVVAASVAAPSDVAVRYGILSGLMSGAVRDFLGLRGFFMQLKIERCNDVADLEALLPDLAEAIAKPRGRDFAREWERGVRQAVAN
jgi:hypothetical protein